MTTALEGLRVLELSTGMASAMAGMLLAEYGAEVIKVEPPGGDPRRGSPAFIVNDRAKKSVVLDLKSADGLEKFKSLVPTADGLIDGLAPGTADRLGIGYNALSAINPRLVYFAITGFGERGPLRDLPGYESIVSAKSGRMASQEGFRAGPIFTPTPTASYGAAMLAVQGMLGALYARQKTGKGQRLHASLLNAMTAYDMGGFVHQISRNDQAGPVVGVMPLAFMTALCKDRRFIQMASRQPHLFRNWMKTLGLEHLYEDSAFHKMPDLFPSQQDMLALLEMVESKMKERTVEEWLELFTTSDVGGDPFLTTKEFMEHPQTVENGRRSIVLDPTVGETVQIGPMINFSETPAVVGPPAPALGQHTAEVLGALRTNGRTAAQGPASPASLRYPLEGVTIVECAYFYAVPFALTMLAEMGARIIKVEPPEGDPMRRNFASVYTKTMQGKDSVVLNLKSPEGQEIVHKLVAGADIFIHNFRPGTPKRIKIDYRTLSAINPRLVYIYGSCYGSKGPWLHRTGFHSTPNALAGSGIIESGLGNPPRDRHFPDPASALGAAACAMIGLHSRERTGKGQYMETTMLTSMGYALSSWNLEYKDKPQDLMPDQGQHGYHALHRLYETGDGWLFLMCPKEEDWRNLSEALGLASLQTDSRFSAAEERRANDAELARVIEVALGGRSAAQWEQDLLAAGVPAVRADGTSHSDFMLNSSHARENGLAVEDELLAGGPFWRVSNCIEFSELSSRSDSPRPLGWATEDILREIGYTDRQIDDLAEKGVTRAVGHGLPAG